MCLELCNTSLNLTTCLCFKIFITAISLFSCCSIFSFLTMFLSIIFIAHGVFVSVSTAYLTLENVPLPSVLPLMNKKCINSKILCGDKNNVKQLVFLYSFRHCSKIRKGVTNDFKSFSFFRKKAQLDYQNVYRDSMPCL